MNSALRSFRRDDPGRSLAPGTVRRVGRFARPFARQIGWYVALVVVDAVLVIVPPLLAQRVVDDGVLAGNAGLVTRLSLVIAATAVLAAGVSFVERWYAARIGEGTIYALRTAVFGHVQRMPVAFFTRTQTGALISRLNSDVLAAQRAFTSTLAGVVSNVVSLILVAGTMLYLAWQVTVASLLLLPLFLIPAKWLGRRLQVLTREQMQLNADMSAVMTERFNVSGAMLAKIFGRPEDEDELFAGKAGRVRDIGVRIALANRVFFIAMTLVASLATALVYLIGGHLAVDGSLSVGTLVALTVLLGRLYGPLTALANVRVDVMTALVSFERVFEVLDLPPLVADREGARPLPAGASGVEFDHVGFRYPGAGEVSLASLESVAVLDRARGQQVLRDVTFRAEPGQTIALVGPSGAGKSTITGLLARLYDVTDGAVRIGGHDVRDVTLASLRDAVGVVTQDSHMFHDTIRANLAYARPGATETEMWAALKAAHIDDLVASLDDGLDTVVGERGHRLSGGEKQRLAIARLLLKSPRVVVLDEATAHLDSESEAAVQQALAAALRGRTALVVAHRLSTIRDADLILVVEDGRITERGRHEDLLAAGGTYADLYRRQFRGTPDDDGTREPAPVG